MTAHLEVMDLVAQMKAAEQAFVLATVVRTVSVTAAKAGAKAIIRPDGTIVAGWIGGGCARGAGGARRRRAAHGVGAAGGHARRTRRQARRRPPWRPLCQQFLPQQGNHG